MGWRSGLKKGGMNPEISERMEGKCFGVGAAGSYGELLKDCKLCFDRDYEPHKVGVAVGIRAPVLGETGVPVRTTVFTLIARRVGISSYGHLDACPHGSSPHSTSKTWL